VSKADVIIGIIEALLSALGRSDKHRLEAIQTPEDTEEKGLQVRLRSEETGARITLWRDPNRDRVAGRVPHNTPATVLEVKQHQGLFY
jgi:hypothetical protein